MLSHYAESIIIVDGKEQIRDFIVQPTNAKFEHIKKLAWEGTNSRNPRITL